MSLVRRLTTPQADWALTEEQRNFGCLRSQRGALPLSELRLKLALRGLDFSLRLTQTFVNVHNDSLEAVYIFPLPARAAVSAFRMITQNGEIQGQLKERGKARSDYQQAVAAGHQAAMVEEERPEIFTMTVGNLPAQETVTIHLDLDGPLTCSDDHAYFRFPLVVAPRFIPGESLPGKDVGLGTSPDTHQVPDASRITPPTLLPGYPNPVTLQVEIDLDSPLLNWPELESTLPLEVTAENRLNYAPGSGKIDHDFLLVMPFHPQEMKSSLQIQPPDKGQDSLHPFCLTLVPPASLSQQTAPKDVVILLDRSGSMTGWSMLAARRTVARLLESLNNRDSFCILAFDDRCQEVRPGAQEDPAPAMFKLNQPRLIEATDRNTCDFSTALEKIDARGGTDIAQAVKEGLKRYPTKAKERSRHLILITDGQIGNEGEIQAILAGKAVKVFTIGIGSAPNAGFLQGLSQSTGGLCQLVVNEADFNNCMLNICRRIGGPSLQNVTVAGAQDLVYQHNDLYPGLATRIYGRLSAPGETIQITAFKAGGQEVSWEIPAQTCQGTVERLWAREQLLQMEYAYTVSARGAPSPQQIIEFSLQYGVLCRFTAFLAIDQRSHVPIQAHTQLQPVSLPAGTQLETRKEFVGGGTIRVDLLPNERRAFQVPPILTIVVTLLLLPILIPIWIYHFLRQQWERSKERRKALPSHEPPKA